MHVCIPSVCIGSVSGMIVGAVTLMYITDCINNSCGYGAPYMQWSYSLLQVWGLNSISICMGVRLPSLLHTVHPKMYKDARRGKSNWCVCGCASCNLHSLPLPLLLLLPFLHCPSPALMTCHCLLQPASVNKQVDVKIPLEYRQHPQTKSLPAGVFMTCFVCKALTFCCYLDSF